jgi:hypothetical protein
MQVELHICCTYVMAARAALARRAGRNDLAEEVAMAAGKMFHELGVEKPSVLTYG